MCVYVYIYIYIYIYIRTYTYTLILLLVSLCAVYVVSRLLGDDARLELLPHDRAELLLGLAAPLDYR